MRLNSNTRRVAPGLHPLHEAIFRVRQEALMTASGWSRARALHELDIAYQSAQFLVAGDLLRAKPKQQHDWQLANRLLARSSIQ